MYWLNVTDNTDSALEISFSDEHYVFIRNSNDPRDVFIISTAQWNSLVKAIRNGFFNAYVSEDIAQEMIHNGKDDTTASSNR